MKSLLRIVLAIVSGISALYAFPSILGLLTTVLGPSVYPNYSLVPEGLVLLFGPCVVVPIPVYYALTYRDEKKIEAPRKIQAFIAVMASLPIVIFIISIGTSFAGPMSMLLFDLVLLLNLFFFSVIVLLSLYYLLRTALQ
jgi:hypothetical protein